MALEDGVLLQEVEFPPTSLQAVCGDAEGSVEMDANLEHASDLSATLLPSARKLRVMLPEESEMRRLVDLHGARHRSKEVSAGYLTTPSLLGDVGLDLFKRDVTEAVSPEDGSFLCAYPSFSVNEMLAVEELHEAYPAKPLVVMNGELDRFRSGYYPKIFYRKVALMAEAFIPAFEGTFYIHNFKGRSPGVLFREYPGKWQVWRRDPNTMEVSKLVHEQDDRPTLREVALEYFV